MLKGALMSGIIAGLAFLVGFRGVAATAAGLSRTLLAVALLVALVTAIVGALEDRRIG